VPRGIFKGSTVFDAMYSLPQAQDVVADGSDDLHPLKLESITYDDFKPFVKAANPW
jgi:hypothetical protein